MENNQINLTNFDLNLHKNDRNGHGSVILPFTIGGFLYIALVGIIPEIVAEKDRKTSFLQLIALIMGVLFIYALTKIENYLPKHL